MEKLIELYKRWAGEAPANVQKLPAAGSNREYYRMADADGATVIGAIGTSRDEDHAFVYLSNHFAKRRLPVPRVLAVSDDELRYLQTDLGSVSLFDAIAGGRQAGGRYNVTERQLLVKTIRELPNIQIRGARGLDFGHCYPQPEFNADSVLFDLNYFKYCFLKPTELDFHELKLEADFRLFAKDLTAERFDSFMYRDFQARLEVAVHKTVKAFCCKVFGKEPEISFKLQLVEIKFSGLEEAVLEVIEVEEHTVCVELRLWVAVAEVEPARPADLYVRQLADGLHQQLPLRDIIAAAGLPPPGDGIEERHRAKVGLQIAELVVAHCQHTRHRQAALGKMVAQVYECVVLVAACANGPNHRGPVSIGHAVVLTVAACRRQLLHVCRCLASPSLI